MFFRDKVPIAALVTCFTGINFVSAVENLSIGLRNVKDTLFELFENFGHLRYEIIYHSFVDFLHFWVIFVLDEIQKDIFEDFGQRKKHFFRIFSHFGRKYIQCGIFGGVNSFVV